MFVPWLFKMTQGYLRCPWVIRLSQCYLKWHRAIFHIVPGLFKIAQGHIPDLYLCRMCLSHRYLKWHRTTFYIVHGSYMFVPVLFQMTQGYISHCPWVIYVCPKVIKNDTGPYSRFVPLSYIFVPWLFKMTLGYIPYCPWVIYVCPRATMVPSVFDYFLCANCFYNTTVTNTLCGT